MNEDAQVEGPAPHGTTRGRKIVLVVLAVLPLALTAAAQPFLPDTVAAHFGAGGVDRWEDKAHLFVPASIATFICLVCIGFSLIYEHLRATNNRDWFVLDEYGGLNAVPFPLMVGTLLVIDAVEAALVGYNIFFVEGARTGAAIDAGMLIADVTFGFCLLLMWGFAAWLLLKKDGAVNLVNGHPGTSERERKAGDDVKQSRAIGALLLFLSLFIVFEWLATRSGMFG